MSLGAPPALPFDLVSPHLVCCICTEIFADPVRAPCGHSFCRACITAWLHRSAVCPEDRHPLQLLQTHTDFILVRCPTVAARATCPHPMLRARRT